MIFLFVFEKYGKNSLEVPQRMKSSSLIYYFKNEEKSETKNLQFLCIPTTKLYAIFQVDISKSGTVNLTFEISSYRHFSEKWSNFK